VPADSRDVLYLDDYLPERAARGRHASWGAGGSKVEIPVPEKRPSTAFAIVLHFDEFSEHRIRQAWEALDQNGVPSAASTYEPGYRPHVTLGIVNTAEPEHLAVRLRRALSGVDGLPVTMTALGFFLTNRAPAYLAVAPTRRLLELHDEVHQTLGAVDSWPYYQPGNWMPHCTLAMDVVCQTSVAEALSDTTLPIQATVGTANLVELPPIVKDPGAHRRTPGAHRRRVPGDSATRPVRREAGRRRSV
jgi:2'-5' RNA ligase